MKITTIEKLIIAIMACCIIGIFFSVRSCNDAMTQNGGVKQFIINTGKEIKLFKDEILK